MKSNKLIMTGKVIGILNILIAIYYFDWNNWNQIAISSLLFLGGVNIFFLNTEDKILQKINSLAQIMIFAIVILFVIFKLISAR